MLTGGNGSTAQPVQRNVKGKKKKKPVHKSSFDINQGSQATHSKGADSTGGLCLLRVSLVPLLWSV